MRSTTPGRGHAAAAGSVGHQVPARALAAGPGAAASTTTPSSSLSSGAYGFYGAGVGAGGPVAAAPLSASPAPSMRGVPLHGSSASSEEGKHGGAAAASKPNIKYTAVMSKVGLGSLAADGCNFGGFCFRFIYWECMYFYSMYGSCACFVFYAWMHACMHAHPSYSSCIRNVHPSLAHPRFPDTSFFFPLPDPSLPVCLPVCLSACVRACAPTRALVPVLACTCALVPSCPVLPPFLRSIRARTWPCSVRAAPTRRPRRRRAAARSHRSRRPSRAASPDKVRTSIRPSVRPLARRLIGSSVGPIIGSA